MEALLSSKDAVNQSPNNEKDRPTPPKIECCSKLKPLKMENKL